MSLLRFRPLLLRRQPSGLQASQPPGSLLDKDKVVDPGTIKLSAYVPTIYL